ncbi:beta(1,3)galactosyltransferase EpsH [Gottfriedia luciferensis]|uniref:Beta(1,3)galactosyltransferase EpsH n=1 Tax=Gottfriedia luciferensis TaxID=178774 RepID=A0ABX2ZTR4_9BACI|nr:PssE/Cps14G family polysaccharide biosynthesis glycosyltransferase [Gottfriedia luciferensis]ODG93166.1 beta(1,3)galactosyltransferase EpsH [Gottfriedia luciferensis]
MIFVTVGSQKFQFNRLLRKIDSLIEDEKLKSTEIFAQIGYSDYTPKYYEFKKFLDKSEFTRILHKSNVVITHGGTGSIINAIKNNKKVIALPRLSEYGEHVDNHQLEITSQFSESGIIVSVENENELDKALIDIHSRELTPYVSNTENVIRIVKEFIY